MRYHPVFAGSENFSTLVIRSRHDVTQLALPVQQIIQDMDHDLPVSDVLTMNQLSGKSSLDQSFDAALIARLSVLSLWPNARVRSGSACRSALNEIEY